MRGMVCGSSLLALLAGLALSVQASAEGLLPGVWNLDLRLRSEMVDDAAFARNASALTLRTRLGWCSGQRAGFHACAEVEDVRAPEQRYNSTANGRDGFPLVADPVGSEWNQAYLGWLGEHGTAITLGRQRLAFGNQRFLGNVGWRQNEQTFDALSLQQPLGTMAVRYAYLDKVHRVFGNAHPNPLAAEQRLHAHALDIAADTALGALSGYAYLIDNRDLPATSTQTLGARLSGTRPLSEHSQWLYAAEAAQQRGWREAAGGTRVDYLLLETGIRVHQHSARIGLERLGANAQRSFQTPLATLHAFNGWADRFLSTPAAGLDDRYLRVDGPVGPLRYSAAWHEFTAHRGSTRYGHELNLQLQWPFARSWSALAKLADYRSDGFGTDVQKLWLSLEYRR